MPEGLIAFDASWILYTLAGVIVLLAVLAVIRVVTRDKTVRSWRFGVFYERERDPQPQFQEQWAQPSKDDDTLIQ